MARSAKRPCSPLKVVMIDCPHCKGTGAVELTGVYADTLALLRGQAGEINGAALAKIDGCKATAMNNRLVRLEEMGLATSRVYGRERLWTARTGANEEEVAR